ncbi:MAG: outer membrane protein transport protein [Candidatus Brocadiaceae bacterium]|nr:outer membrane protein transport protein [Candidatus Brocadiaceae bacterium]
MKQLFLVFVFLVSYFVHEMDISAQIASGFHSPSFSAVGLAQANAFVARADDASAIIFNPAGLTQLKRPQISTGASFVIPKVEYHGNGIHEDMGTGINTIPNLFFACPLIEDKLATGIGISAPYGLRGNWEEDGFSRYVVTDFNLAILNVNPTITFKPFSFLSIGAGLDYYYAKSDVEKRVNVGLLNASLTGTPQDTTTPDGFQDLDDVHGDGVGYNIGILYNITPQHTIGISFRSKADIDTKGSLKFSNLSGATAEAFGGESFSTKARTTLTLPEILILGYAYKHRERWSVEADVQWTNWTRFDVLRFDFAPSNPILDGGNEDVRNWHNTLGFALGGEYLLNETIKLRGGYAFHESPVPSDTFEPSIPMSSRHAVFTGFEYRWGGKMNKWIDFASGIAVYENRRITNSVGDELQGSIDGRYDSIDYLMAINFNYQF